MTQRIMPLSWYAKTLERIPRRYPNMYSLFRWNTQQSFDENRTSPIESDGGILFGLSDEHAALKDSIDAMILMEFNLCPLLELFDTF